MPYLVAVDHQPTRRALLAVRVLVCPIKGQKPVANHRIKYRKLESIRAGLIVTTGTCCQRLLQHCGVDGDLCLEPSKIRVSLAAVSADYSQFVQPRNE